jgi:hypothetical protein
MVGSSVNKFGAFCQNSSKFNGFGPAQIQKSPNLLFINSKNSKNKKIRNICKKTRWNSKITGDFFFQIGIICLDSTAGVLSSFCHWPIFLLCALLSRLNFSQRVKLGAACFSYQCLLSDFTSVSWSRMVETLSCAAWSRILAVVSHSRTPDIQWNVCETLSWFDFGRYSLTRDFACIECHISLRFQVV